VAKGKKQRRDTIRRRGLDDDAATLLERLNELAPDERAQIELELDDESEADDDEPSEPRSGEPHPTA
jgi:hypothetical protein